MRTREVAGGGRAVEVDADRLEGWYSRFARRHGGAATTVVGPDEVLVRAADGATATAEVPFGPLKGEHGEREGLSVRPLVDHLMLPRRVGIVLMRLGGHSVGIAEGGRIVVSATGRKQVHGRAAAGGWSQQRFARRREGQARRALDAAVADVRRVLLSRLSELDAVAFGGDRGALAVLKRDRQLRPLLALAMPRVLDVGEPRRTVLDDAARRVRSVEIVVREPDTAPAPRDPT